VNCHLGIFFKNGLLPSPASQHPQPKTAAFAPSIAHPPLPYGHDIEEQRAKFQILHVFRSSEKMVT
jgi:hypothetical protein